MNLQLLLNKYKDKTKKEMKTKTIEKEININCNNNQNMGNLESTYFMYNMYFIFFVKKK